MEWTITYSQERNLATIQTKGRASVDGFEAMTEELLSNPQWNTTMNILVDHRQLDNVDLDYDKITKISNLVVRRRNEFGTGRMAIVFANLATLGLSRMWKTITEDYVELQIGAFDSIQAAEQWLTEDT